MTAAVQTNSFGAGSAAFAGGEMPTVTLGAHTTTCRADPAEWDLQRGGGAFVAEDEFLGAIDWSINSFGVTAVASQNLGWWTPFAGVGCNYATGSVSTRLVLKSSTRHPRHRRRGSARPEKVQGRVILGASYDRQTWSLFANSELKAVGR